MPRPQCDIVAVKANFFYDLIGMVVKIYRDPVQKTTMLYISDYTPNPAMMDYTSSTSWTGPTGQRTLQVSQWGLHRIDEGPRLVKPGMFVRLENVLAKLNRAEGLLEGTMFAARNDYRSHSTVISLEGNIPTEWKRKIQMILNRKKVYEDKQRRQSPELDEETLASQHFPTPASNMKRPFEDEESGLAKRPKPAAKTPTWKLVHDPLDSPSYVEPATRGTFEGALSSKNPVCHYLKGRIVDFYPDVLEEWIVGSCPVCRQEFSNKELVCPEHDRAVFEYYCAFKIESPNEVDEVGNRLKMTVVVDGKDAESLFPSTLRATPALPNDAKPLEHLLRGLLDGLQTAKRDKKELSSEWDGSELFEFVVEGTGRGKSRSFKFSDMKFECA